MASPAGPAIAAFSIAHHITGLGAWTAALVIMALAAPLLDHDRCHRQAVASGIGAGAPPPSTVET
jgi:hypothetical protein